MARIDWREMALRMAARAVLGFSNSLASFMEPAVMEALPDDVYNDVVESKRAAVEALDDLASALRRASRG